MGRAGREPGGGVSVSADVRLAIFRTCSVSQHGGAVPVRLGCLA